AAPKDDWMNSEEPALIPRGQQTRSWRSRSVDPESKLRAGGSSGSQDVQRRLEGVMSCRYAVLLLSDKQEVRRKVKVSRAAARL
ncbi:hypothetical protein GBF38_016857, partial [Nibea albiflora]